MGNYGNAAVRAARSLQSQRFQMPRDAWDEAVEIEFPSQLQSQRKGCPRGAFIGLCEAGLVRGVEHNLTRDLTKNGEYAIAAAEALNQNPALAHNKSALWQRACADQPKVQNGQMDVVIALKNAGMLNSA